MVANLSSRDTKKVITNKIFYNLDNISIQNMIDKKDILQDIVLKKDSNIIRYGDNGQQSISAL